MKCIAGLAIAMLVGALVALPLGTSTFAQEPEEDDVRALERTGGPSLPPDARAVDLVIALDVSGSMKQLLDTVRARLWDVVNELAGMNPTPSLRVGLLTYGSRESNAENGWIVKYADLTRDLDRVHAQLALLETSGDVELVGRALHTALHEMTWSNEWDALKMIFIAGNESADQGAEEFDFRDVVQDARNEEILVNALYAGDEQRAMRDGWHEIAQIAEGSFAAIGRASKVLQTATPQDAALEELNAKLNATYLPFGDLGKERHANVAAQDEAAAKLGVQSLGSRVRTKSTRLYDNAAWDLVDAMRDPDFDWTSLREADLPEQLRGLSDEDLLSVVEEQRVAREEIQRQILEVSLERERHLRALLGKQGRPGFTDAMRQAIRSQAEAKGFTRDQ